jgi:hypothetical protein
VRAVLDRADGSYDEAEQIGCQSDGPGEKIAPDPGATMAPDHGAIGCCCHGDRPKRPISRA